MITDVVLDEFLVSIVNQGISGVRNNDLSAITTAIDFLDTQISNTNSILEDPYLSQNNQISINQSRLREIYFNFRTLLNVYRIYLQQTNGVSPYSSWVFTNNSAAPFNSTSPSTYMSSLQPMWYVGRDDDGDGQVESIVPETDATNRVQSWASSTTTSAGLYRTLRASVDSSSGVVGGRVVRKKRGKMGGTKVGVKTSEMGSLEFVEGTYFDPIGVDDPGSDFQGGGGIQWESGGGINDIPIDAGGGSWEVDPSRYPVNWQDTLRERYVGLNTGTLPGRSRSLSTGGIRTTAGIPILPVGGINPMYSTAAGVTDMQNLTNMSAMGLSSAGQNLSSPVSSYYSAPAGAAASSLFSAPPQPRTVQSPGNCVSIKYSFKIRQISDKVTRRFFGFNIKGDPKLVITMYAACPNSTPTELFTTEVTSYPYFQLLPDRQGNFVTKTKDSLENAVGIIKYAYYYDLRDIITKIYQNVQIIKYPNNLTVYEDIIDQLTQNPAFKPFVDNFGPQMGNSPGKDRENSFFTDGVPPTGFITQLPPTVQDLLIGNDSWYNDTTAYTGMSIIGNFFFMGRTEYAALTQNDVKLSSIVQQQYPQVDKLDRSITSLIDSKVMGEVESVSGGTGTGTGAGTGTGTGGRTGGGTGAGLGGGINSQIYTTGINNDRFYGTFYSTFTMPTSADCSAPRWESGASGDFMWNLVKDDQTAGSQITYPEAIRHLITQVDSSVGQITGGILNVLRGDRNSAQFQLLLQNGLTPMQIRRSTIMEPIPGNPCLQGLRTDYQWGIRRQRIIPWKIFCNTTGGTREIDYKSKPGSEIDKWVLSVLLQPQFEKAIGPSGELLRDRDGYYYSVVDEMAPIEGAPNEPGIYFSSYSAVERSLNNVSCIPVSRTVSTWKVDADNPCGCDEVEVLTHYVTYPEVSYVDPLSGETVIIKQTEDLDRAYPAPLPESRAASYGLTVGQELTDNRREKPDCFERTGEGRLHHPFLYGTDILPGIRKKSIKGLFNLSQSLDCYYTSSIQNSTQKEYYYEITDCDNCKKTAYFAVAYGNHKGSGSLSSGYEVNDSPSRAIYSQYRLLALDPYEKYFTFYDGGETNTPDDIYVINYYRNGLSDKLDIGNFEINIAELSGSGKANNVHTGSNVAVSSSNKVLSLIDNSSIFDSDDVCANEDPNYYYDVVSGSLANGIHASGAGSILTNENITTYGKVYPNLGIIVLDGHKLNVSASFNNVSGSNINGDNSFKLFTAISGAAAVNKPMRARNVKFKTTNHYFVRIPSGEANYSNNPTYVIDSGTQKGRIKNMCFVDNPMTYITTIGLYNTKKDLIAVAKLSKPIKKTKENDVLIKIRLNW
jgi:hypothetical protein